MRQQIATVPAELAERLAPSFCRSLVLYAIIFDCPEDAQHLTDERIGFLPMPRQICQRPQIGMEM